MQHCTFDEKLFVLFEIASSLRCAKLFLDVNEETISEALIFRHRKHEGYKVRQKLSRDKVDHIEEVTISNETVTIVFKLQS